LNPATRRIAARQRGRRPRTGSSGSRGPKTPRGPGASRRNLFALLLLAMIAFASSRYRSPSDLPSGSSGGDQGGRSSSSSGGDQGGRSSGSSGGDLSGLSSQDAGALRGRVRLQDGDSFTMGSTRIRLFGIDAFEGDQDCPRAGGGIFPCGVSGKMALDRLIRGREVTCSRRDVDRYDRIVATCRVGEVDLARRMVEDGWALAYRRYSRDYVAAEEAARKAGRGVWAAPGFVEPWEFRARKREAEGR
jgi:endonuclease YncB( thermonuclease family)